eukprot:351323-Chlamydomonas_euryale.AAC.6
MLLQLCCCCHVTLLLSRHAAAVTSRCCCCHATMLLLSRHDAAAAALSACMQAGDTSGVQQSLLDALANAQAGKGPLRIADVLTLLPYVYSLWPDAAPPHMQVRAAHVARARMQQTYIPWSSHSAKPARQEARVTQA